MKFYDAAFAKNAEASKLLTKEAIDLLEFRQAKYFKKDKSLLITLDNIFLSMEGVGQFVAVAWLSHSRGGNIPLYAAVDGFRRKRNQWSQEEGLAMFLVLNKLTNPDWANDVFGARPQAITDLLGHAAKK